MAKKLPLCSLMKKITLLISALAIHLCVFAQHPPVFDGITSDTLKLQLYDLAINAVKYRYQNDDIKLMAIHDDEDTGIKAAFAYIQSHGGSVIDCQYGGVRNFRFTNDADTFQIDPNAIYTLQGRNLGLSKYSAHKPNEVLEQLDYVQKKLLNFYEYQKHKYFITLHNNADGGFGINSYLKGYDLESTADSVHINFEMDNDDLIFVTDLRLYNYLKAKDVNVILQSKDAKNDGSMSVFAAQQNIPYINIEVQHGHLEENIRLLTLAVEAMQSIIAEPAK